VLPCGKIVLLCQKSKIFSLDMNQARSPAQYPAENLIGTLVADRWRITTRLNGAGSDTTGGFFSIPYEVVDVETGRKAFMKVLNIQKAEKEELKIAPIATSGLIAFRAGDEVGGRAKYREAIKLAEDCKLHSMQAVATLFLAREERIAKTAAADSTLKEAVTLADKHPTANSELIKQVVVDGPKKRSVSQ